MRILVYKTLILLTVCGLRIAFAEESEDKAIASLEMQGEYDDSGHILWLEDNGKAFSKFPSTTDGVKNFFKVRSAQYETGTIDLTNLGIGFINGISTSRKEAKAHAERLSSYGEGIKVQYIYNASHHAPIDVMESILGRCGVSTPPVRLLKRMWKKFFETHDENSVFLQVCHSQGAITVKNALDDSSSSLRKRVIVVAIAPATIISKKLCLEAYHYMSKDDVVPAIDFIGKAKRGSQLIKLKPHKHASGWDHNFDSPTYQEILQEAIKYYIENARLGFVS